MSYTKNLVSFTALWLVFASNIVLSQVNPTTYTREQVEAYELHSNILNRDFTIEVSVPLAPVFDPEEEYPVMYTYDAEIMFPHLASGNIFQASDGKLPGMISVGINYAYTSSEFDKTVWRWQDLTAEPVTVPGVPVPLGGGADAFLDFINLELKPFINSNYPTDENEEYYYGHSLGGLFGLYTLFTQTDTFEKYLISSPSIWVNDKSIYHYANKFIAENPILDKRVHMIVGSEEIFIGSPFGDVNMVTDMKEMYWFLKWAYFPSPELSNKIYFGESHTSVIIPGYFEGVRTLLKENPVIQKYYESPIHQKINKIRDVLNK